MASPTSSGLPRRTVLGAATAAPALLLGTPAAAAQARPAAGWVLKWSPNPGTDGLGAFEGIEDDRAKSHPGVKHITVQGDSYRFDMHTRDRDGSDRQRNEVKGMRAGGKLLEMDNGQTWRLTYSLFIPSTLKATTTFSHIWQTKMPGSGTAPITVMSLRRHGNTPKIELKVFGSDTTVGAVDLAPLQDKWIDTEIELRIGNAPDGQVRWVVRNGGSTVLDARKTGVDTWMDDRVRPKWGIYRSLGDTSGSLQNCHLLLRNMRAYQWQ